MESQSNGFAGMTKSPGGFVFGVQGWTWGEPRPTSITFFLDNTAKVSDQHGRPIRGTVVDGKKIQFADSSPNNDDPPNKRAMFATHAQVIAALAAERYDWLTLSWAGWPQLPYAELKKLGDKLPPTNIRELRKIKDKSLRADAIRIRNEYDEAVAIEMGIEEEYEDE